MSERPNNNPDGGNNTPNKGWLPSINQIVGVTRNAAVGAMIGTLALPGYGTVIGAVAGPVVGKMLPKNKE